MPNATYYVWGAQTEQSSTRGPYVATNSVSASGSGGLATLTTNTLPVGSDAIVATYSGDGTDLTSASATLTEVVNKATPAITWANPTTIIYGAALGGTQLNATASAPGSFAYSPTAGTVLDAGTHTLSVTFSPTDTADYNTATATVTLTVSKATPTISLTSSANPSTFGSSVTFTAAVAAGSTGTVTFKDGAVTIGTGSITGGLASLTTTSLSVAAHSITAVYAGDSNYIGSTSPVLVQTVTRAAPAFSFTSTLNPSQFGVSVTLIVQLTGASGVVPTGVVVISESGVPLATLTLDTSGKGIYTTGNMVANSHSLKAVYGGDANYQ
jgi:hypothetical protein